LTEKFFIDIDCQQKNHHGERICGDVFVSGKIKEENRIVMVLSDGMGHGVKASVLGTLTATMAMNFTKEHKEPEKTAEIIMNTLPECSERRMNYSTFTIIDVEYDGKTSVLEYDNPPVLIIRDHQLFESEHKEIVLNSEKNSGKKLHVRTFYPQKGDRIIFTSDGIAQSGLGTPRFPFGWGNDNVGRFVIDLVKQYPKISARELAVKVLNMAYRNDGFEAKDDISCGVIYYREPRELLICTGPPFDKTKDSEYAEIVHDFTGKKIVMGATTGDILSRELNLEIKDGQKITDPDLPPLSYMKGIDLYTEGILTLNKVEKLLNSYHRDFRPGDGPADQILKFILESDEIHFIIGTRINIAHQDPAVNTELEMRRTVVKRIALLLEEKFLKKVQLRYI
jgi:hypothetical protein